MLQNLKQDQGAKNTKSNTAQQQIGQSNTSTSAGAATATDSNLTTIMSSTQNGQQQTGAGGQVVQQTNAAANATGQQHQLGAQASSGAQPSVKQFLQTLKSNLTAINQSGNANGQTNGQSENQNG